MLKNKRTVTFAKKYSFWCLLAAELRFSLTMVRIFNLLSVIFIPCLLSFFPLFIRPIFKFAPETDLFFMTISALSLFIITKNVASIRDKATIDKNRTAFLYYDKNKVIFTKLIVEIIMFVIAFLCILAIANIWTLRRESNVAFDLVLFNTNLFLALPGLLTIFLFLHIVSKWIIAAFSIMNSKLGYAITVLTATIIMLPLWILNQIPQTTTYTYTIMKHLSQQKSSWFAQHQNVTVWLPFFNFGLIVGSGIKWTEHFSSQVTGKLVNHDWYTLIPILYCIIFLCSTWQFQTKAQKKYLVAS